MEFNEKDIDNLKNIIDIEKDNVIIHKIEHNFYRTKNNTSIKGMTEYIITEVNGKFDPIFVKIPQ